MVILQAGIEKNFCALAEYAGLCYTLIRRARSRAVTLEGDEMVQKEITERTTYITGEEA